MLSAVRGDPQVGGAGLLERDAFLLDGSGTPLLPEQTAVYAARSPSARVGSALGSRFLVTLPLLSRSVPATGTCPRRSER